jgi:hypothetical protein
MVFVILNGKLKVVQGPEAHQKIIVTFSKGEKD